MSLPVPDSSPWGGTLRLRSEVLLTGGRTVRGDLHLLPFASSHYGSETVDDALARDTPFFPLTGEDGRALLIAKAHVLLIEVPQAADLEDPERISAAHPFRLAVELSDGSTHTGTVASELPTDQPRILDLLNQRPGFFPLRTAELVRYINRAHVRVATPLD